MIFGGEIMNKKIICTVMSIALITIMIFSGFAFATQNKSSAPVAQLQIGVWLLSLPKSISIFMTDTWLI